MTPNHQEPISYHTGMSSLGTILAAVSRKGVAVISLSENPEILIADLLRQFPQASHSGNDQHLQQILAKLINYVEFPATSLDLELDVRGSAFQQQVWQALRQIPPGETRSYGQLARQIGAPKAFRAVAAACAANRLALAIPCHRVIAANGKLSGYRWGVERKAALLNREAGAGEGRL
ncbi:MAG: methylated-DNA--[protein]-cysteine S-methyltransferase [Methylococcales bacterium]|nr:methylated-DNA--[protein]-cysteine S-methyltransferase [Methylococcales bacterium]